MSAEPVPGLAERVLAAVRERWPGAGLDGLAPLHGGISSLTFSAVVTGSDRRERRVVVKVAPPGLEPVRNRDVLRQARVMAALYGAPGVRVPAVLARDRGTPPFFVMEHVPGESYEPAWDAPGGSGAPAADVVRRRALAAARMLAALQAVAPAAVGLGDEPVLSPADELERWVRLFATAGEELRGDEAALAEALRARVPETTIRACVLHGDYRLGNLQCAGDEVAGIIDWEIWSVGDPRHDLAWLMLFADPVMERSEVGPAAAAAMPPAEALLAEYLAAAAGHDEAPPDLAWFRALAHYKLSATMAVLAKRNRRLAEPDPGLERAAQTTPATLARGTEILLSG